MKKPAFKIGGKKKAAKEDAISIEPTVERTPEDDPIMEDREDRPPSPTEGDDARSPPEDAAEDASVDTEALSTVKEEPSKEEAEDLTKEVEEAPKGVKTINVKAAETLDEDLTLDHTAATDADPMCSAEEVPAFCGCLGDLLK